MAMFNPVIHAIGTAVPPFRIPQNSHAEILADSTDLTAAELKLLKAIYNHSGIDYRYSVLEEFGKPYKESNSIFHPSKNVKAVSVSKRMDLFDKFAPSLAAEAVTDCMKNLPGASRQHITHLITFSCTGMSAPGLDLMLADLLQLPSSVERTCINFMGCYAAVNAMKTAWHISKSDPDALILIAGVELCTLHFQPFTDKEHLVSNALFADGAAAALISSGKYNMPASYSINSFHSEFFREGDNSMVWKIHENGFDLRLDAYVPTLVKNGISGMAKRAFDKMNITQKDIQHFAIHPGGKRILQACEEALNINSGNTSVSHHVLKEYGNMSSVTLLFVLKELHQKTNKGDKVFSCAFGPGLTMESAILTSDK